MNLQTIRKKTAYNETAKATIKDETRTWLRGMQDRYAIALTLTLKQTIEESTGLGT